MVASCRWSPAADGRQLPMVASADGRLRRWSPPPMVASCRWSPPPMVASAPILIRSNNARQSAHGNKPYLYSRHAVYRRRCANPHGSSRLRGGGSRAPQQQQPERQQQERQQQERQQQERQQRRVGSRGGSAAEAGRQQESIARRAEAARPSSSICAKIRAIVARLGRRAEAALRKIFSENP